jgi:hypothetical protein
MPRIAISGHRGLPPQTTRLIEEAIRLGLADRPTDVIALSCLADGPDQIFARAALDHGGTIEAVVPADQYRDGLPEDAHAEYDALMTHATKVHHMPFTESDSEAHMAASRHMVDHSDELWAVWDGQPARGYGGTADVVGYARGKGAPVRIIWPDGATRDA